MPLKSEFRVVHCKSHHSIDLYTTSYRCAILSIALSCTVFEIFDIEEYRYLEI